jgi:DNA-directed RNA polymerase specialized sigma24 family protein
VLRLALEGNPQAMRTLVDRLTPVVQTRVARGLLHRGRGPGGRDLRQEVEDFTQEVFLALFRDGGRALRAWDPERGLSLENFVGLLAQHQVASILRTGRTSGWIDLATEADVLERAAATGPGPDQQVATREMCQSLLSRLAERLSPRGLDLFWRLVVREEPVDAVCADTGMTADAVYTWRSRVSRLARSLATEPIDGEAASELPRRTGGIGP